MSKVFQPIKNRIKRSPIWPLLRPRDVQIYGVGAPKTGTVSINRIFEDNFRSVHEADKIQLINAIEIDSKDQNYQTQEFLKKRDHERRFEIEVSHFLVYFVRDLVELFPEAKFILTYRDPYSWLKSIINQHINFVPEKLENPESRKCWRTWRNISFGNHSKAYPKQEEILKKHGVHSINDYLKYWDWHNRTVINTVSKDRLLIIETTRISEAIKDISSFTEIDIKKINSKKSHSHKAKKKHRLLNHIDEIYIKEKIEKYCSETQNKLESFNKIE